MNVTHIKLQTMPISEINEADYNPRKKLTPQTPEYERLKNSILTYGYIDPLIYNTRLNRLVGGHQRLQILKDLGVEEVQVSVVDLPENEEKQLNIILNNVQGEFNPDKLGEMLLEMEKEQVDIDNLGFNEQEFNDIISQLSIETEQNSKFLDDFLNEGEEVEPDTILDNTGLTERIQGKTHDNNDTDVNVNQNGNDEEQDVYPTYTTEETNEPYEKEDGEQYFKLTFPVTFEERDIVMEAIKQAKKEHGLTTSAEAILRICNHYLGRTKK